MGENVQLVLGSHLWAYKFSLKSPDSAAEVWPASAKLPNCGLTCTYVCVYAHVRMFASTRVRTRVCMCAVSYTHLTLPTTAEV